MSALVCLPSCPTIRDDSVADNVQLHDNCASETSPGILIMSQTPVETDPIAAAHAAQYGTDRKLKCASKSPDSQSVVLRFLGGLALSSVAFLVLYRFCHGWLGLPETVCCLLATICISVYVWSAFILRPDRRGQDYGWVDSYWIEPTTLSEKLQQVVSTMRPVLAPGRFIARSLLDAALYFDLISPAGPREIVIPDEPELPPEAIAASSQASQAELVEEQSAVEGLASARFLDMYRNEETDQDE